MKTGTIKKSSSLSTRALLVSVNISQWSGRKIDKRATETANTAHKADVSAGNYHKKLLPMAKELEAINTLANQTRKFFHKNTLPWMSDGTRIISGRNYIKFQTEMRKISAEFENSIKAFEAVYQTLKTDASSRLGDLYDAEEYPDNIGERFGLSVDFYPLPESSDFRIDIGNAEKKRFQSKLKDIETKAMIEVSQKLLDVIKTATDRLKEPESVFRDSLLANISEVADLIPMLNINNDAKLDQLSQEAKDLVNSIDTKVLRTDSKERDKARKALYDIESRMGAFMGKIK